MRKSKFFPYCITMLTILASCGGSTTSNDLQNASSNELPSASLNLNIKSFNEFSNSESNNAQHLMSSLGQSSNDQLNSLKYYISQIAICKSLIPEGTGFSNQSGCLQIYQATEVNEAFFYELSDLNLNLYKSMAEAAQLHDEGYIDFMDASSRQQLNQTVSLNFDDARSYQYGFITWYLPIKLKGTVTLQNATVLRTLSGEITQYDPNIVVTKADESFATPGFPEESIIITNNGGAWFKFQNPFNITGNDINEAVQFNLDLVFNPNALLKAQNSDAGPCESCYLTDSEGNSFSIPLLNLTPVPYKQGDVSTVESYRASVNQGNDHFDVRLEIYSVDAEGQSRVYGVDLISLVNDNTTQSSPQWPKVAFTKGSNNNLRLLDYRNDEGKIISNINRQTSVGGTFTATVHCSDPSLGGIVFDGCAAGETQDLTFELLEIRH